MKLHTRTKPNQTVPWRESNSASLTRIEVRISEWWVTDDAEENIIVPVQVLRMPSATSDDAMRTDIVARAGVLSAAAADGSVVTATL
jgi:hypothetical protein